MNGEPRGDAARARKTFLALAAVVTLGVAHGVVYALPFEDSFITFRYAEHLAGGDGLVWNPGERVEGCSSFLWTVLLAGVARLGLPVPGVAVLLSLLAASGLLIATWALGRRRGLPHGPAILAATGVAAHGTFAYFGASGMETSLFALAVCTAAWLAEGTDARAAIRAGAMLGVATWIRPEGLGYSGAFALAELVSRRPRRAAETLVLALALATPLVVFRLVYFGYPLPNTSYAKATPSAALLETGAVYAVAFFVSTGFLLTVLAALRAERSGRPSVSDRRAWLVVLAATGNAVLVGGDTFGFFRTFLPALGPGFVLIARAFRGPTLPGLAAAWGLASAFVPRLSQGGLGPSDFSATRGIAALNADYFAVGRFLSENLPSDATIALNAAGIVPYVSRLRAVDMLGLNDVHIAHHPVRKGESAAVGHQKHDAAYVLSRRPDVILPGLPVLSPTRLAPEAIGSFYARYARFLPGDRELFANPDLALLYRPVVVPVGEKYLPMFVRRSGVF
ncbi:MAG TPA: hypothetical protein VHE30_30055 [Polyangiaceae bacterium]|nr:hypothetical protein [Polyangiaceae bacterium]